GDRITSMTHSMIKLVIEKRRDEYITGIAKEFAELRRENDQVTRAVISSANPLGADDEKRIVAKLETELGRKVEAEFETDASLLGGVKIVYDNFILDGSVRGQLDKMRDKILYDVLKQG
ncbi:MAG: ATP synthase F1 subunit delta, partial [Armatimonadota bacterium]